MAHISIANQCPMIGGNAVYRAPPLYSLIDDEQVYDDETICLAHGIIIKRLTEHVHSLVSVIPNPATAEANLVLGRALAEPSTMVLYDAIGAEVIRLIVPAETLRLSFSLSTLAPALPLPFARSSRHHW